MIIAELQKSPFRGLPGWFPVDVKAENVTVLGYAPLGMTRLGDGTVYAEHRGESNKIPDGIIADSADALADVLVSEDRRCRERLKRISTRCGGMDYQEFRIWMEQLISTKQEENQELLRSPLINYRLKPLPNRARRK